MRGTRRRPAADAWQSLCEVGAVRPLHREGLVLKPGAPTLQAHAMGRACRLRSVVCPASQELLGHSVETLPYPQDQGTSECCSGRGFSCLLGLGCHCSQMQGRVSSRPQPSLCRRWGYHHYRTTGRWRTSQNLLTGLRGCYVHRHILLPSLPAIVEGPDFWRSPQQPEALPTSSKQLLEIGKGIFQEANRTDFPWASRCYPCVRGLPTAGLAPQAPKESTAKKGLLQGLDQKEDQSRWDSESGQGRKQLTAYGRGQEDRRQEDRGARG